MMLFADLAIVQQVDPRVSRARTVPETQVGASHVLPSGFGRIESAEMCGRMLLILLVIIGGRDRD